MSDRALKNLIMVVMVILVLNQFVGWVAGSWGTVPGALAALVVLAVSFFFGRKARADAGKAAWFLVPVLLFAVQSPVRGGVSASHRRFAGCVLESWQGQETVRSATACAGLDDS
jgi:hypothetical protein